ncbi:hypothetical protein C8R46DRAFT_1186823 [Mycena filopes]|nr:hypothetical protein C8R46DRAFT_1186823 [Mycena filopes]
MKEAKSKEDEIEGSGIPSLGARGLSETEDIDLARPYMDAYRQGLNVRQAAYAAKKYKSHRRIPADVMADVNIAARGNLMMYTKCSYKFKLFDRSLGMGTVPLTGTAVKFTARIRRFLHSRRRGAAKERPSQFRACWGVFERENRHQRIEPVYGRRRLPVPVRRMEPTEVLTARDGMPSTAPVIPVKTVTVAIPTDHAKSGTTQNCISKMFRVWDVSGWSGTRLNSRRAYDTCTHYIRAPGPRAHIDTATDDSGPRWTRKDAAAMSHSPWTTPHASSREHSVKRSVESLHAWRGEAVGMGSSGGVDQR